MYLTFLCKEPPPAMRGSSKKDKPMSRQKNSLWLNMFVEIPPKYSVSSIMGYLKGKSSLMIYEKFGNLKFKYRNREFWCRGYYVDTVGKNAKKIAEYMKNQLEEDKIGKQMKINYKEDPYMGSK